MPELPEIETICQGIIPHIVDKKIKTVIIRQSQLRWPVTEDLARLLSQQTIKSVYRRGKYLLLQTAHTVDHPVGHLLIHLGMSGNLRILPATTQINKHDHVDIIFEDGSCLRYHDPRRFGCILWTTDNPDQHPLLVNLGVEPLMASFNASYLAQRAAGKSIAVKNWIMNSQLVVGIGNIYANEALFLAKIHPLQPVKTLNFDDCQRLVTAIQQVLQQAILLGGTTLRDFTDSQGKAGYFQQELAVYHCQGEVCKRCQTGIIQRLMINQRASFFCPVCQPHP